MSGATRAETKNLLKAGKPEHTSARTEITLADDAVIDLEMLEGGSPISFQLNGTDFGALEEGDIVVIDEDRNVTVNGTSRGPQRTPARAAAQHVARFTHGAPGAGNSGITTARVEGRPFSGFDETNFSSIARMDGAETEVNFEFRLLDSRDGKGKGQESEHPMFAIEIKKPDGGPFQAGDRVSLKASIDDFSRLC